MPPSIAAPTASNIATTLDSIDIAISIESSVVAMLLAVGAAMLGGIYPSWHAARARPALAMREE